jgi:vacuolar-type H+-ATPase subunit I/STV1
MSTTTEEINDELKESIKNAQDKEVSYILEASQIDDKRSKYLAKKNDYTIAFEDGSTENFKRKPLSSRKNKEIDDLRTAFAQNRSDLRAKVKVNGQVFETIQDVLYEAFIKTAEYCLGMDKQKFETALWEDFDEYTDKDIYGLRSVLGACLLRAVHGSVYFPKP